MKVARLPKLRFHGLGHTAASLLLNHGIPVLIASKRLGHSKASITMDAYGHMMSNKHEETAALLDRLIKPDYPKSSPNCTRNGPNYQKTKTAFIHNKGVKWKHPEKTVIGRLLAIQNRKEWAPFVPISFSLKISFLIRVENGGF